MSEEDPGSQQDFEEIDDEEEGSGVEMFADELEPDLVGEQDLSRNRIRSQPGASQSYLSSSGWYTVEEGDCLSSIAYRTGFAESTIWKQFENRELRKKRNNPNILFPGDRIFIPEKTPKEESCDTDKRHQFVRKDVPAKVKIRVLDYEGKPCANTPYVFEADGVWKDGKTDENGYLEHAIRPHASRGKLTVNPGPEEFEYPLTFGGVDPLDEISGVQSRLMNLGYDCDMTGELDESTRGALRAFQADRKLKMTGEFDDDTRESLQKFHEA